jgi:2-keto-4-pentenoate hydratase/2-oxohepta-3-ene-1,7-dioic acid hydratase in catechol pathway
MEIRRRYTGRHTLQTETRPSSEEDWLPTTQLVALGYASPFSTDWEARNALGYGALLGGAVLPFQPLSVHRVQPIERHDDDRAKAYVRRIIPPAAALARNISTAASQRVETLMPPSATTTSISIRFGNPLTYVPSGTPITMPAFSGSLDYELQLGFVISKPLLDATVEEALAAVSAFVLICEFTACELRLPESGFGPLESKQVASSMASAAISAEDLRQNWRRLTGSVTINGELVAEPATATVPFGVGDLISYASAGEPLSPGELFAIGSLQHGSGTSVDRRLKAGDELALELGPLGRIEHAIR